MPEKVHVTKTDELTRLPYKLIMTTNLSKTEKRRYHRHLIMPEIGERGQMKLKAAKVLVVGAGGLGCPLLQYLAAAGVGIIGIVDFDRVEESNLHRQILYTRDDIGKLKTDVAVSRVQEINHLIEIVSFPIKLTSENAREVIKNYDIVADGTDNFATRYLINDACYLEQKINVFASIFRFEGQLSVFNYPLENGVRSPNYRDLFPEPPPPGTVPNCAEAGVLGVLPGIMGALQANEVIKVITGNGDILSGKLFTLDTLSFTSRVLRFNKRKNNPLSGDNPSQFSLIDYELFCNPKINMKVPSITVKELAQQIERGENIQIIDVRRQDEYEFVNIGAPLMPMEEIEKHIHKIDKDRPVIVHCRSGKRSADVIIKLQELYGYDNLINLEGGILAWAKEIDPSLPTY